MHFTVTPSSQSLILEVCPSGPWRWGNPKQFGVGPLFTSYLHQAQRRGPQGLKKGTSSPARRQVAIVDAALENHHLVQGRDGRTLEYVDLRMVLETADPLTGHLCQSKVHQKVSLRFAEFLGLKAPGWAFETAMERCVREFLAKITEQEQAATPQRGTVP